MHKLVRIPTRDYPKKKNRDCKIKRKKNIDKIPVKISTN